MNGEKERTRKKNVTYVADIFGVRRAMFDAAKGIRGVGRRNAVNTDRNDNINPMLFLIINFSYDNEIFLFQSTPQKKRHPPLCNRKKNHTLVSQ